MHDFQKRLNCTHRSFSYIMTYQTRICPWIWQRFTPAYAHGRTIGREIGPSVSNFDENRALSILVKRSLKEEVLRERACSCVRLCIKNHTQVIWIPCRTLNTHTEAAISPFNIEQIVSSRFLLRGPLEDSNEALEPPGGLCTDAREMKMKKAGQ